MKVFFITLLLTSCTAAEVGNTILPDEFTYGQGSMSSAMAGKIDTSWGYDAWPMIGEEEGESTYAALPWHLPSIDEGPSKAERVEIRKEALMIDEIVNEDVESPSTMASGGVYTPDWRHAAVFGGILALLLIILLIKLQRSNGWH